MKYNLEGIIIKEIPINLLSNVRTRTLPVPLNLPVFPSPIHCPAFPSGITAAVHLVFHIYLKDNFTVYISLEIYHLVLLVYVIIYNCN